MLNLHRQALVAVEVQREDIFSATDLVRAYRGVDAAVIGTNSSAAYSAIVMQYQPYGRDAVDVSTALFVLHSCMPIYGAERRFATAKAWAQEHIEHLTAWPDHKTPFPSELFSQSVTISDKQYPVSGIYRHHEITVAAINGREGRLLVAAHSVSTEAGLGFSYFECDFALWGLLEGLRHSEFAQRAEMAHGFGVVLEQLRAYLCDDDEAEELREWYNEKAAEVAQVTAATVEPQDAHAWLTGCVLSEENLKALRD